jgi:alkylated DNA repair dioxygenase AlkB
MSSSMSDLFESISGETLPVPDADLRLWQSIGCDDKEKILRSLIDDTRWRQEHVTLWGRTYPQPRLVAFYGDAGLEYTYSGVTLQALPWPAGLRELKDEVESLCGASFNTVLLNYYRDQRDSMGFHSDDEPELGPDPVIASLSFGEERPFVLKHRHRDDIDDIRLELPSGSLLLMKGATQANWKHGIPKRSKVCGPRVNLTFRIIR